MWLSDIRFWIRSARSDAQLQRLLREHDNAQSLDLLYEERKDPWGLNSPRFRYQQIKYATMLSLLPSRRYKRALDLGCGLGNLTRRLRNHADQVLGIDVSHVAIAQATREATEQSNLQFQQGELLVPGGILLLVNHFTLNFDPGSRWSPKIHQVFRSAPAFTTIHESRRPFYLASVFEKSL